MQSKGSHNKSSQRPSVAGKRTVHRKSSSAEASQVNLNPQPEAEDDSSQTSQQDTQHTPAASKRHSEHGQHAKPVLTPDSSQGEMESSPSVGQHAKHASPLADKQNDNDTDSLSDNKEESNIGSLADKQHSTEPSQNNAEPSVDKQHSTEPSQNNAELSVDNHHDAEPSSGNHHDAEPSSDKQHDVEPSVDKSDKQESSDAKSSKEINNDENAQSTVDDRNTQSAVDEQDNAELAERKAADSSSENLSDATNQITVNEQQPDSSEPTPADEPATAETSDISEADTSDTNKVETNTTTNSDELHEVTPRQSNPSAATITLRQKAIGIAVLACVVVVFIASIFFALYRAPIDITVNGSPLTISGFKTVEKAFEAAGEPANPGNLVDVEGEILEEGGGYRFSFVVNGEVGTDYSARLSDGDIVEFTDGANIEEESNQAEVTIPFDTIDEGNGAIHVLEREGTDGAGYTKTGKISGKTVTVVTTEPQDRVFRRYSPDTGNDKVIALTFDDGPSDTYTSEILDILEENDAKATFFTVGSYVKERPDLVQQELAAGHQVCTHTWDHASGSGEGVSLAYMSADEQREEITKGIQAIENATNQTASTVIRAPGGNFPTEVWTNVYDLIEADIGWTIDTVDWSKPGAKSILEELEDASSGDIILMHDGGGNRSQTVKALSKALPYLKKQGYSFITIDEMLEYPMKED